MSREFQESSYPAPTQPPPIPRRKVSFDPTINLGHLLSFFGSFFAAMCVVLAAWATMDKRILVLEESKKVAEIRVNELRGDLKEALTELKRAVEKLNDKLDSDATARGKLPK